jgi:glycyl-tRNA synthetase beta chain
VIADAQKRKAIIEQGVRDLAGDAGGDVVEGERLYDEVTALVEWPVPLIGHFDEAFLELPREVVVSTLTGHQRYFPVADKQGNLLPAFITVANIESRDPDRVRDGNERVIRPRLADAAFFWRQDRQVPLAKRLQSLADVVYQQGLGSLHDKAERTAALAAALARELGIPGDDVERAARLAKCDLVTGMVGEFPELQGTMGRYYTAADGESETVARAIGEQYLPRHAGDELPASEAGRILAVADRLETLAGIFTLGKRPSGNRDPFGLRRAALGVVRILVECGIDIDLKNLVEQAADLQPAGVTPAPEVAEEVFAFINDRLRRYFLDNDPSLATETFDAVLARAPVSLVDFGKRLSAVQSFLAHDAAESLAAANKRIANILRKADIDRPGETRAELFEEDAEQALYHALAETAKNVRPMIEAGAYTEALEALAGLRAPVDRYFDEVMVMTDDDRLRNNRLALLGELRALFLNVADISRLAIGQGH